MEHRITEVKRQIRSQTEDEWTGVGYEVEMVIDRLILEKNSWCPVLMYTYKFRRHTPNDAPTPSTGLSCNHTFVTVDAISSRQKRFYRKMFFMLLIKICASIDNAF